MSLFFGIIIAILALIFSFQNIDTITVSFFKWEFTSSLALILIATLLTGFITAVIVLTPSIFKANLNIKKLINKNKKLEKDKDMNEIVYETEGLGSESVRIGDDDTTTIDK